MVKELMIFTLTIALILVLYSLGGGDAILLIEKVSVLVATGINLFFQM